MNIDQIKHILSLSRWSDTKLEEAARGKVIGSCADDPEVEFKFWVELARDKADREKLSADTEIDGLIVQALRGEFG